MNTPEDQPNAEEALARAARKQMAAALDEDQEPEADEPVEWQPIWKRPRTPKPKAAKKNELCEQRRRLQDAAKRRLVAGNSRRPRSRQNRLGNVASRRDARALSHCGAQAPGCGDDARHHPLSEGHPRPRITTGCRTSSGLHSVGSTRPSGAHSGAPDDNGLHRGAHHDGAPPRPAPHHSDDARHSRRPDMAEKDDFRSDSDW